MKFLKFNGHGVLQQDYWARRSVSNPVPGVSIRIYGLRICGVGAYHPIARALLVLADGISKE